MEKKELLRKLSSEYRFLRMQAAGHPDEARKKELLIYSDVYLLCLYIVEKSKFPEPIGRREALEWVEEEIASYEDAIRTWGEKEMWCENKTLLEECKRILKGEYRDDTTRSE